MPTYQYQCAKCNRCFELKQGFNDKPIAICPVCRGVAHRLFSPVPILFKGPGFYVTDSRQGRKQGLDAKGPKKE
jgi:putative FmdB family regulatory protein